MFIEDGNKSEIKTKQKRYEKRENAPSAKLGALAESPSRLYVSPKCDMD